MRGARPTCQTMIPGIIAAFAFVVSIFGDTNNNLTLSFGIWYYQSWGVYDSAVQGTVILETCENYPDGTNIDAYWRTSRAFSTMAIIIGGVVTFWALLAPCLSPSKKSFKTFGMAYMICCLFIGLSLLLLNSTACHDNNLIGKLSEQAANSALNVELSFPETCSMGPGANCTIAAIVLWFVAGVLSLRANPHPPEPITTQTHDVTYTKTTGEDGGAVVSETVIKGTPVPVGQQAAAKEEVEQAV